MVDNNRLTMVQKCQMTNKKLVQTSAPKSRAKDQHVIFPTSKKESHHQLPPASQHWSVFTPDCVLPLLDM
jgi:hypothetical protein